MTARVLFVVPILLCACPEENYPFELQVGTGTSFTTIAPGAEVRMVCGPQGGQHIWTAIRVRGVAADELTVSIAINKDGERICGTDLSHLHLTTIGNGYYDFAGVACFIPNPALLDHQTVTLEGTVRDFDGVGGSATATFVALAPPADCRGG